MHRPGQRGARLGVLAGLGAAVLFGAATPFSKELLADLSPQVLAGLLYLGAFSAVGTAVVARRGTREPRLQRQDTARLVGLIASGGVIAPVLLLLGLERIQGTSASLLLNLEGVATLAIGVVVFREHLSRRATAGAVTVFGGAALLAIDTGSDKTDVLGVVLVALACVAWGIDNNLTQSLSVRDPFRIVAVKAGAAAIINLVIAVVLGDSIPLDGVVLLALGLGAISYGVSIVLDAYALRLLGAARESIVFATAPFIGAVLSVAILAEHLGVQEAIAGVAMLLGIVLVATERHAHRHVHETLVHDHLHTHDEHHQHAHLAAEATDQAHSHLHEHEPLAHEHAHVSDVHHRHSH